MKTLKIMLFFVAVLAILAGCNKDKTYADPTLAFENNVAIAELDFSTLTSATATFKANIDAEAKIKELIVTESIHPLVEGGSIVTKPVTVASGYANQTKHTYQFTKDYTKSEFAAISKVVIKVEVIDKEGVRVSKEFTIKEKSYTQPVTFTVKDEANADITDAVIKLGETTNAAGTYVFNVLAGTYNYEVTKAGFVTATGTVEVTTTAVTKDIVLRAALSDWSANEMIAIASQTGYASYNGVRVTVSESAKIGGKYTTNPSGTQAKLELASNCQGFVEVADAATADTYKSQADLAQAYAAGTSKTELLLTFEFHAKVVPEKIFISKLTDGTYSLVKYVDGQVYASQAGGYNGNVLVFQYKK